MDTLTAIPTMRCMLDGQINFSCEPAMREAFDKLVVALVGIKNKWQVGNAALLLFMSLPEDQQRQLSDEVAQAQRPGKSVKPLIEAAVKKSIAAVPAKGGEEKKTAKGRIGMAKQLSQRSSPSGETHAKHAK